MAQQGAGHAGRELRVGDFGSRSMRVEQRGPGTRLLFDKPRRGIRPLDPSSILVIAIGPHWDAFVLDGHDEKSFGKWDLRAIAAYLDRKELKRMRPATWDPHQLHRQQGDADVSLRGLHLGRRNERVRDEIRWT